MGVVGNEVLLFHLVLEGLLMPMSSGIQSLCGGKERVDLTEFIVYITKYDV